MYMTSAGFSVFTDYTKRRANAMASQWRYEKKNSSYWGEISVNFLSRKMEFSLRVSEEFWLSDFEITE